MQTFLAGPDFDYCAHVLDRSRLAGQRKEGIQLVHANERHVMAGTPELIAKKTRLLEDGEMPRQGWKNHTAARMWAGRTPALLEYLKAIDREWVRRGYKTNLIFPDVSELLGPVVMPSWIGDERVHSSHRAALLHKLPEWYAQFGWAETAAMDYYWPGPCANLPGATPAVPLPEENVL